MGYKWKSKHGELRKCSNCKKPIYLFQCRLKVGFENFYCSRNCRVLHRLKFGFKHANYKSGHVQSRKIKEKISKAHKGKRFSEEHRLNISKSKRGSKAYQWKGEGCGYRSLHHWVEKELGKPKICEFCKNSNLNHRQYNWANKSHEYKRDLSDWLRLCVKCHKNYDKKSNTKRISITTVQR